MDSLPSTSLKCSPPTEVADLQLCKSTSFLSCWVILSPAGVRLIIIHYTCAYGFLKKNRMKRLCVAHIINPQYRLTELHVFLSSCCLLGYRLGKETKVLNVPFVHQGIVQSLDFWKMKVFLLFNILTNGGSSCAHTGQCKDLWVRRPLGGNKGIWNIVGISPLKKTGILQDCGTLPLLSIWLL